jgi:hypothetical protein
MTDTPEQNPADVLADLDKVESLVATARRILADGGMIDLSALEEKVEQLCLAAKEAPPEERERVVVALEKLIGGLDELAKELTKQFGAIGGETEDDRRGRAADAYTKNAPKKPNGTT